MQSQILYEDKEIIIAHKPAGIAVQTARLGQQDMVSELKNYLCRSKSGPVGGGLTVGNGTSGSYREPYLGIVHRLDQPVEGILAFAKTKASAANLTAQLQGEEETFCKRYYAVLCGIPVEKEGRLTDYLEKQAVKNGKLIDYRSVVKEPNFGETDSADIFCPGDRQKRQQMSLNRAVLEYRILQVQEEKGLALADITILTGRFHQIRAQMAHAGTPLLGDLKYGSLETKDLAQRLHIRNVALCAYQLNFRHPVSKEPMHFQVKPTHPAFSSFSQL